MTASRLAAPRAVVFDWDNTLVDSWGCIQESYNRTFRHFGMPEWSMEEVHAKVARSLRDSFPEMFGERWTEARDVFSRAFAEIHLDLLRPLPGADAMLEALDAAGLYLAVVSNKRGSFLRTEAEALGWTGRFGRLVGADDAEADKPHPAPVRMALEPARLAPGPQVWFVGDSAVDMDCAVRAGCTPVLLRPRPPADEEFPGHAPLCHLSDCGRLAGLVRELAVPISGI